MGNNIKFESKSLVIHKKNIFNHPTNLNIMIKLWNKIRKREEIYMQVFFLKFWSLASIKLKSSYC